LDFEALPRHLRQEAWQALEEELAAEGPWDDEDDS
jgi:hypothetical protein